MEEKPSRLNRELSERRDEKVKENGLSRPREDRVGRVGASESLELWAQGIGSNGGGAMEERHLGGSVS